MTRHLLAAALIAALALALGAAWGARAGLAGAAIASATGLASLLAFRLFGHPRAKPMQRALAIFAVMFVVRLVLVALGLVQVTRAHLSPVAFVVAFFASYFAFVAVEGSYVHALARAPGKTA